MMDVHDRPHAALALEHSRLHPDRDHGRGVHPRPADHAGRAAHHRPHRRGAPDQGGGRRQGDRAGAQPLQARQRLLPDHRAGTRGAGARRRRPACVPRRWNPEGYLEKVPVDPWGTAVRLPQRRQRVRDRCRSAPTAPRVARATTPTSTRATSDGCPMRRAPSAGERGFTLLELGLAVALIGLLVTIVLPRLGLLGGVVAAGERAPARVAHRAAARGRGAARPHGAALVRSAERTLRRGGLRRHLVRRALRARRDAAVPHRDPAGLDPARRHAVRA